MELRFISSRNTKIYEFAPTENGGLVGYWNFEEGEGYTVYDLSGNGNDGTIDGATYTNDVAEQSCQLTTINGCDSVAILNLTITEPDTSFTNVVACESYQWNGETYFESGTYEYSEQNNNEFSISFDGVDDYILIPHSEVFSNNSDLTISLCFKSNESYIDNQAGNFMASQSIITKSPIAEGGTKNRAFEITIYCAENSNQCNAPFTFISGSSNQSMDTQYKLKSEYSIFTDNWYNVTFIISEFNLKQYINVS